MNFSFSLEKYSMGKTSVTVRPVLAALLLCSFILSVESEEPFAVQTKVIGPGQVRLSWEDMIDKDGNVPVKYRVLCTARDSSTVEAVSTGKTIEMDTFKEGLTYSCEVHPIYDDLVEGMEVVSANPGTSAPFELDHEPIFVENPSGMSIHTVNTSINNSLNDCFKSLGSVLTSKLSTQFRVYKKTKHT